MNVLLKITVVFVFLLSNGFSKDILFDLDAQDFQNSSLEQQLSTKYNIDEKVIIKTNLLKNPLGYYHTNSNVQGVFTINSSWPVTDWKFNLDVQYEGNKNKNRFIKFTDIHGEVILLEFHSQGFIFNSKDYKANIDKKHLLIQLRKVNEEIIFYLNKQIIQKEKVTFSKLKSVETTLLKYNFQEQDKINNILLVSHD